MPARLSIVSKAFIELLGSMFFHFIGSVSPTPITNGLALMVLVLFCGKVSGANLNPAVSLSFALIGYMHPLHTVIYSIAQVSGSMLGALLISALVPGLPPGAHIRASTDVGYDYASGCAYPRSSELTDLQLVGWESMCTCVFILSVMTTVWYTQHKHGYGNTGPLIIGFSLTSNILAASRFSGGVLNPARAIGSAVVFRCPEQHRIIFYVCGQYIGAVLASMVMIPFYGVAENAWFSRFVPSFPTSGVLKTLQTTIQLTNQRIDSGV